MTSRTNRMMAGAGLVILSVASVASATNYTINWMQMTPTPFNSAPPYNSSYNLPGVGTVQMSYTGPLSDFAEARFQSAPYVSGSVAYGPDNYAWSNNEVLARTNWAYSGTLNSPWQVTYTFPGTVSGGQLVLGVLGLGRRDPRPGENPPDCISTASVLQNGTHFGDWTGAQNVGPTQFTSGAGTFSMINSLTGPNGVDPWWNTGLAVVRIDDAVSSLTVNFAHTAGDGLGVNIGIIVPEPASLGLLSIGGLWTLLRRRRSPA